MKKLICFLMLLSALSANTQELTADANTLLLLHFNNTTTGAAGEMPVSSSGISYDAGRFGQALLCSSTTTMRFDTTQNLYTNQGTIEFWVKPEAGLVASSILDMRTTNGFFIELGNFTSMYINTLPANPNPQVSVSAGGGTAYFPGTWYHLAFTWGNHQLRMYLNGKLNKSLTYNFDLSPVPFTSFTIAANQSGGNHYLGLIDEFRISKIPRSESEICNSFLMGMGSILSLQAAPASISLRKGWYVSLTNQNMYQSPQVTAVFSSGNVVLGNTCINWTVSDANILEIDYAKNILKAKAAGSAQLIGVVNGQNVNIPVQVTDNPFAPERLTVIDPSLTTPASCHTKLIPTVAIIYLPTNDGINIDQVEVGNVPVSLAQIKQNILEYSKFLKFSLEEGSKYRGYQNANALPYIGYKVVEYIFVYEPLPKGYNAGGNVWFADYNQIMDRFNGKRLVDTMGVREVWLWGYHFGQIAPVESNMASPQTSDISNSNRYNDDMPVYDNTYILYNYNYERGGNEAVHNHGHQFESMLDFICNRQDGNTQLFSQKFRGYTGGPGPLGRCGDTHHPPNSISDYDYCNNTLVASDILDWKPAGGTSTMVNCNTWSSIPYNWPPAVSHVPESNWYILWMQSFPGSGNVIPHGARWMTNWWRFLGNWDNNTINIGLHQASSETTAPCVPLLNPALTARTLCAGASSLINYNSNNVTFLTGNVFTAQLSDANGTFNNPVNIGTSSSVAANGTINISIPLITDNTAGNTYQVRIVSSNPVMISIGSDILLITSTSSPALITAGGVTTFCTGSNVTLTSNAASGNQWYKDGIAISGSTAVTCIANMSGSYAVKVTSNGCASPFSNAVVITVNPIPPTPVITQNSNQVTSNAASGNQWYLNGSLIPGATSQNYTPLVSGNYTVQVTVGNCTSVSSNTINFIVTGLQDLSAFGGKVNVMPNPVTDKLIITNTAAGVIKLDIQLIELNGKQLASYKSGSLRLEIDMKNYAAGTYLVVIRDKTKGISGIKLIIKQ